MAAVVSTPEGFVPGSNRLQISNTKRPLYHYIFLATQCIERVGAVELSGLGLAISAVVTVSRILESSGVAVTKRIETDSVPLNPGNPMASGAKAKLTIWMEAGTGEKLSDEEIRAHAADHEIGRDHE